ncbi:PEP-CTERM sorting domain-containing protein [Pseudoduganella sp.]|uniref:PEP-CTERM sorting domain-containing protein n=1 Tax=Pseudoduganella sp. TaxID=1880898 RepID=UPI0035B2FCC4
MNILKKTLGAAVGALGLLFASGAGAAEYALLSTGATHDINSAIFTAYPQQPTGSGNIDPFVRLKRDGTTAEGYNTTVIPTYDNFGGAGFNHEITVGGVGFISTPGGTVMRFLLDIDQTSSNPLLSLDKVQIYISTVANQSVSIGSLANSALVYDMDAGGDNYVKLDYNLNNGSGSGDMTLDIPLAMFMAAFAAYDADAGNLVKFNGDTGLMNGAFIYLYSRFGDQPGMEDNDGFEEWTHFNGNPLEEQPCDPRVEDCGPREIPEPGSLVLFSLGLLGSAIVVRRGRQRWMRG